MADELPPGYDLDQDAMTAAADLVGRSGAGSLELGHLDDLDDVPIEEARWYAHAQYRGTRISVENHRGPVEAMEALARRLLSGGQCAYCARPVVLAGPTTRIGKVCRWSRQGDAWVRGCVDTHDERTVPAPEWVRGGDR